MELANLEEKKMEMEQLKMEEQQREEGDDVTLLLSLPGQRTEKMKFKLGVTIAYAKLVIQKEYELEGTLALKMESRTLIDPLSLGDCPGVTGGSEVKIVVECS